MKMFRMTGCKPYALQKLPGTMETILRLVQFNDMGSMEKQEHTGNVHEENYVDLSVSVAFIARITNDINEILKFLAKDVKLYYAFLHSFCWIEFSKILQLVGNLCLKGNSL